MTDTASIRLVQASEREQIVAWLREQESARLAKVDSVLSGGGRGYDIGRATGYAHAADAIERGDYLATPVEPSPVNATYAPDGLRYAAVDQHDAWLLRFSDQDCGDQWFGGPDYTAEETRQCAIDAWNRYAPAWSVRLMRTVTLDEVRALQSPPVEQPDTDGMPPNGCTRCASQWNSIELCDKCEREFLEDLAGKSAPAEAQQPSDGLVEELANLTRVDPGFYILGSDLRDRILAAFKTRTSPETVELLREARKAHWFYYGDDCSSDTCRFGIDECISEDFEWDNAQEGDHVLQISGARPVPDMWVALHYFTEAEKDARNDDEPYTYTVHETEAEARAALDAHLSNTPGKESSDD